MERNVQSEEEFSAKLLADTAADSFDSWMQGRLGERYAGMWIDGLVLHVAAVDPTPDDAADAEKVTPRGLPPAEVVKARYSASQLEDFRQEMEALIEEQPLPELGPPMQPGLILGFWIDPARNLVRVTVSSADAIDVIHDQIPPDGVNIEVNPYGIGTTSGPR